MHGQGSDGTNGLELGEDSLALLQHVVRIANQLPGDWSHMGGLEPGQEADDAYRFQLSAMVLMLATVQYHHTPAYRELCKSAIEQMIDKMMRFDTWGYWELSSRGGLADDPELQKLGEGWIDPVERKNIMYSGHLLNMINLHEMFYRTGRFEAADALKFEYSPMFRGMGPETFEYNEQQIVDIVLREFEANAYLGCECEPNLIFPYCNQYPILALMLHDHIQGTSIAPGIMEKHTSAWLKDGGSLFSNQNTDLDQMPLMHFVKQGFSVANPGLAVALSIVLNPWKPDYAKALYGRVKEHLMVTDSDGALTVDQVTDMKPVIEQGADPALMGVSTFGFMLLAAREMGDQGTADALFDFANRNLETVWDNGCLTYNRNDEFGTPHYATRLTINGMIPWASVNPESGLSQIYNTPWLDDELNSPEIVDVDYPNVLVSRARYDRHTGCLQVNLRRGVTPPKEATFRVANATSANGPIMISANGHELPDASVTMQTDGNGFTLRVPFDADVNLKIGLHI